jgi:arylsulfatase
MTGASFAAVLSDPAAAPAHDEQYGETQGHRSFYRRGWEAVTYHRACVPFAEEEWQLYDVAGDPVQAKELSREHPERVQELAAAWDEAAWANGVYPLGDLANGLYRLRPPSLASERRVVTLTPADHTLEPNLAKALVRGGAVRVVISLEHAEGDQGMLVAHGDQGGGYALYVEEGTLLFAVNDSYGLVRLDAGGLPAGSREVVVDLGDAADGTWDAAVAVDGRPRGVLANLPAWTGQTPLEGIDVGIDRRSPVCWDVFERHGPFPYTGELRAVTYVPLD